MATSTESNCIPLALFVSFPHVFLFLRPFPCPRKRHEPVRAAKRDDVVPSELSSLTLSVILRSVPPFPSPFTLPRFPSLTHPAPPKRHFFSPSCQALRILDVATASTATKTSPKLVPITYYFYFPSTAHPLLSSLPFYLGVFPFFWNRASVRK